MFMYLKTEKVTQITVIDQFAYIHPKTFRFKIDLNTGASRYECRKLVTLCMIKASIPAIQILRTALQDQLKYYIVVYFFMFEYT